MVNRWKGKIFTMKRVRLTPEEHDVDRPITVGGETVRVSEHPKMCANQRLNLTLVTEAGLRFFLTDRELEMNKCA